MNYCKLIAHKLTRLVKFFQTAGTIVMAHIYPICDLSLVYVLPVQAR